MKVLKNNYNSETNIDEKNARQIKPYPRKLTCEQCRSELEYDEADLRMGALGCMYLDCPCCGYDNMIDENEHSITLTVDNVEFPVHFFHTSESTGAVNHCNNEEIKNDIRKAVKYFRENKGGFAWFSEFGNLYIGVYRWDGDEQYQVIVSNDFYSTYIPFESQDY